MIMSFLQALEASPFAVTIAESGWMFPLIESIHVLALALVLGSIAIVDLRLLNLILRKRHVTELTKETLPWTWAAFLVAATTGLLMFSSAATRYWGITAFRVKMVLLLLAGVNMLIFNTRIFQNVAEWDDAAKTPVAARVAGALSLTLWVSIMGFGRLIGFS